MQNERAACVVDARKGLLVKGKKSREFRGGEQEPPIAVVWGRRGGEAAYIDASVFFFFFFLERLGLALCVSLVGGAEWRAERPRTKSILSSSQHFIAGFLEDFCTVLLRCGWADDGGDEDHVVGASDPGAYLLDEEQYFAGVGAACSFHYSTRTQGISHA
jgi:hypothetical protein